MHCQLKGCKVVYKTKVPLNTACEDEFTIFSKYQHSHPLEELDSVPHYGIKDNVKQLIKPLLNNKVKPNKIQKVLKEYQKNGFLSEENLPTIYQISDLRRNQKKQEDQLETLGDFTKFIEVFGENNNEDTSPLIIGKNLIQDEFCRVFSSKNLLKNVILQARSCMTKYVCIDGTYRLTVLGYPLVVVGTQDNNHKFKLIALGLTKHEREKDFKFILNSVQDSLQKVFQYQWNIDLLLSDSSFAIYSASKAVFGNKYTHGMCSVHFWRNVQRQISIIVPVDRRKELKKDLEFLKNIHETLMFDRAIDLFEQKWEDHIPEFLEYLLATWVNSVFCNWYNGSIPPGFSTMNNGIEGFNNGLKVKYTEWERLEIGEFIKAVKEIIQDYSQEGTAGLFPISISIEEEDWKKAQITQQNSFIKLENNTFYWGHSLNKGTSCKVTQQVITKYQNINRCRSLKAFMDAYCVWKVDIGDDLTSSSCTCPRFRLYHYCKHIIASLLKLEFMKVPEEFSIEKIVEQNNRRGRIKKAETI